MKIRREQDNRCQKAIERQVSGEAEQSDLTVFERAYRIASKTSLDVNWCCLAQKVSPYACLITKTGLAPGQSKNQFKT